MWVIGHRGAAGHAPENTMAAFRRGVELGATFLEADLHLSRDARFVCIHDDTLDRTTSGRGPVHALTLAELKGLDAGSWFGAQFTGEKIPALEELLAYAATVKVHLYLELKSMGAWEAAQALVGAIREAQAAARVVVISFDAAALEAVHQRDPTLLTGLIFEGLGPGGLTGVLRQAQDAGARQIAPRGDLVSPELLAEARRTGLQVVTWTINEVAAMRRLAAAGVHGIITNYPDRLIAALKES